MIDASSSCCSAASWPAFTRSTAPLVRYRLTLQVVARRQRVDLRLVAVDDDVDLREPARRWSARSALSRA